MESLLETLPFWAEIEPYYTTARDWLLTYAFVVANLIQVLVIAVGFVVAHVVGKVLVRFVSGLHKPAWYFRHLARFAPVAASLAMPLTCLFLLWVAQVTVAGAGWPHHILRAAVSLLAAWVAIRLATSFVASQSLSKVITVTAWSLAALNLLGLLTPTMELLDTIAISLGNFRLSLLGLIKAILVVGVLLWGAGAISDMAEKRIAMSGALTPSARVLMGKLVRILLVVLAVVIGLNTTGIDLTALAVFSGALGLGIGFGLQKVVSNFVSGMILLLDKSVKPGDVIVVSGTYGTINSLRARYVSVITRDGVEHLIPNEDLISQRVENWTFTDKFVRMRIKVGVSYGTDPRLAQRLMIEAADHIPRVLEEPRPVCNVTNFSDSSIDLELRVWIADPENGMGSVRSAILLAIWDKFKAHGVEIPYPQRDIHIRSAPPEPEPEPETRPAV